MTRSNRTTLAVVVVTLLAVTITACGGSSGGSSTATQRIRIELTSPTTRGSVTDAETTITGVVSEPSSTVTIGDLSVDVGSDGSFTQTVPLAYGSNRITIRAAAEGFTEASRTVTITRNLTLEVSSPGDELTISQNSVTVAGTVSDPAATVRVMGYLVPVGESGEFSRELPLYYPTTIIPIVASVSDMDPISQQVTVFYSGTR